MDSILSRHPDRVPVYVEKRHGSDIPDIDRHKYLIPKDMSVAQFMVIIRKRIKIEATQAIFIFVDNSTLPPNSALFGDLYKEHARPDRILHITFTTENTFG